VKHFRRAHSTHPCKEEGRGKVYTTLRCLRYHNANVHHPEDYEWFWCKNKDIGCEFAAIYKSTVTTHEKSRCGYSREEEERSVVVCGIHDVRLHYYE